MPPALNNLFDSIVIVIFTGDIFIFLNQSRVAQVAGDDDGGKHIAIVVQHGVIVAWSGVLNKVQIVRDVCHAEICIIIRIL